MALSPIQALRLVKNLRKGATEEEYYYHHTHELPRIKAEGFRAKASTLGREDERGVWTWGGMEEAMASANKMAMTLARNPSQTMARGHQAGVVAIPRSIAERYGQVTHYPRAADQYHLQLDEGTIIPPEELVFHNIDPNLIE
jgi:hypothetical protein